MFIVHCATGVASYFELLRQYMRCTLYSINDPTLGTHNSFDSIETIATRYLKAILKVQLGLGLQATQFNVKSPEFFILSTLISLAVASQSLLNQTWQDWSAFKERGHEVAFVSYDLFTDLAKPWGFEKIYIGQGTVTLAELKVLAKEVALKTSTDIQESVDIMWSLSYKWSYLPLREFFIKEKPDLVMCDIYNFGCIDAAYHLDIQFTVQTFRLPQQKI
ncbi:hypothetical protein K7432_017836 [Basidiobolus ranarum]|uniref:Uncharacterized protein n=1 Tax=Basidiobolus ranarum TaxID=34480 RepID=A0ABR2WCV5_9FUNG